MITTGREPAVSTSGVLNVGIDTIVALLSSIHYSVTAIGKSAIGSAGIGNSVAVHITRITLLEKRIERFCSVVTTCATSSSWEEREHLVKEGVGTFSDIVKLGDCDFVCPSVCSSVEVELHFQISPVSLEGVLAG
jgi:hypothetical protein